MEAIRYIKKGDGWLAAPPPLNEEKRLSRLRSYAILDSTPEESFDRVTRLAVTWFNVPFALVSLVDENRQWFKSCIGADVKETDRDLAFCSHAILQDEVLVIPDASKDERFRGNPLVTGDMHIRFYAGCPLVTADGYKVGTLCVIDQQPRDFTTDDDAVLASLAALVTDEMDLRSARLRAEEENANKSQYVAYMSHEVRTPLTTIQSALALMQDKPQDEETRQYLQLVSHATTILMETINDFLDVTRMETQAIELEEIAFKPEELMGQVTLLMGPRLKPGVTLETHVEGVRGVNLLGDPTRLRQILLNFTSNAAKFTAKGAIHVTSRLMQGEGGNARLRFEVRDSGIGIAPGKLPHLFKKFKQEDASTARRYGGSGLGLHICKLLAEMMDGQVGATSEPGKGSSFWFEAPFRLAAKAPVEKEARAPAPGAPCHILLVEDTKTNQMLISALLRKQGHTVSAAFNGREAVESAGKERFDLILMDCQMPEMDGFEATRHIRADAKSASRRVPIIALTANAGEEAKERCLAAGMNDYLTKPVTVDAMQRAIGQWSQPQKKPGA